MKHLLLLITLTFTTNIFAKTGLLKGLYTGELGRAKFELEFVVAKPVGSTQTRISDCSITYNYVNSKTCEHALTAKNTGTRGNEYSTNIFPIDVQFGVEFQGQRYEWVLTYAGITKEGVYAEIGTVYLKDHYDPQILFVKDNRQAILNLVQ